MVKRWAIGGLAALLLVWGLAYYYGGVDANWLRGWWKSSRTPEQTPQVVNVNTTNTPVSNENTNSGTLRFTGFSQTAIVAGFSKPTRMAFEPETNDLLVGELDGKIWRIRSNGSKQEVASGFNQLLGISFDQSPQAAAASPTSPTSVVMVVASRGTVSLLEKQSDGRYGKRRDIVTGLPAGRHQTDLAIIHNDGKLYIATGSRSDRGETSIDPKEATILVADADGSNLKVFASGLRNPFGMTWFENKLYVSDNGKDVPANGVPDELNLVEQGKDYGWPGCYGVSKGSDCAGTVEPIALLQEHSSANGFAFYDARQFPAEYYGNAFIALWGANSKNPDIGKKVVRMIPTASGLWRTEDFVTGLGNPIDVKVNPNDGSLYILDFGRGNVLQVKAGYETQ